MRSAKLAALPFVLALSVHAGGQEPSGQNEVAETKPPTADEKPVINGAALYVRSLATNCCRNLGS